MDKLCERCNKEHNGTYGSGRFCSIICANTRIHSKETKQKIKDSLIMLKKENVCKKCGKIFNLKKKTSGTGFNFRKFCEDCFNVVEVISKTKKELFDNRTNWQSARNAIQKVARKIYQESDKPKQCMHCTYDKHYEVCHIKSVSSFDDDTLISEINNIDNLIALCPNHHWEFDNGILKFD